MSAFTRDAGERLIDVLANARSNARHIEAQLDDISYAAVQMGNSQLAVELEAIGERIVIMAEEAWHAHGAVIREDGQRTADGIGRILVTLLGTDEVTGEARS